MTRRLGKLIVRPYMLQMITYAIPVWGYLVTRHKTKPQSLLDHDLRWATKALYLFSNANILTSLGVRSLNATI